MSNSNLCSTSPPLPCEYHTTSYRASDRPISYQTQVSDRPVLLCNASIISHPIEYQNDQSSFALPMSYHIISDLNLNSISPPLHCKTIISHPIRALIDRYSFALQLSYHIIANSNLRYQISDRSNVAANHDSASFATACSNKVASAPEMASTSFPAWRHSTQRAKKGERGVYSLSLSCMAVVV